MIGGIGWDEDDFPPDGWLLRAFGLVALWLFAVVMVGGLFGLAVGEDECSSAASRSSTELSADGLSAVQACIDAAGAGVPFRTILVAMTTAGLVGALVIVGFCRAAVSSGHGRVRGRGARLREGW